MFDIVRRERRRARTMPRRSPFTRVTGALSIATSVPVPMAIPTCAWASAGASLIPSPAIATKRPSRWRPFTTSAFWSGSTSATTSSRRSLRATASAVVRLSPVSMTTRIPSACSARMASGVLSLIGSATPSSPTGMPLAATNTMVWPSPRRASARSASGPSATPRSFMSARFPSATARPSTVPRTPFPVTPSNPETLARATPRTSLPCTIAAASGCSLPRSSVAARRSSVPSSNPAAGSTVTSLGLPSVSVPVLSTTSVSTLRITSIASAFRKSTPMVAPFPVATMIDIGVASPSAHGQAMMSTATALMMACAMRGCGPQAPHTTKVTAAIPTTMGTNQPDTKSASFWMGARLRCASATIATMRERRVSAPTFSARMTREPVPFTVAPTSRSPGRFSTGMGSPLTIDSSIVLVPSRTRPSTGTFSPGRTRSRSPTRTSSSGTSSSPPSSRSLRADFGAMPRSFLIAALVRLRALSSSTWPRRMRVTITPAASKYGATSPASSRKLAGNTPGRSAATTLYA